jgi:hypothetical protein
MQNEEEVWGAPLLIWLWFAAFEWLTKITNECDTLLQHLEWNASRTVIDANIASVYTDIHRLRNVFNRLQAVTKDEGAKARIERYYKTIDTLVWDLTNLPRGDRVRMGRRNESFRLLSLHASHIRGILGDPTIEMVGHIVRLARRAR